MPRQQLVKHLPLLLISVLLSLLLSACVTQREDETPPGYLTPSGWQDVDATLSHDSFTDHASAVKMEVTRHRIPLEAARAEIEIERAAPIEVLPAASCSGSTHGIAILVHGLSDTAFAMKDIANVMAEACYKARTILLPGHGTRPGDLLTTRRADWSDTVNYALEQAAAEHDHVVAAGFSLGAVLTLDAAMQSDSPIDALMAFSPAYYLSTYNLAKWTPWVHRLKPWIDRGIADDAMRYEAMPTRGVVETVRAMQAMHRTVAREGEVNLPWLVVQSWDDAVILPADNLSFLNRHAGHPTSRVINFAAKKEPLHGADRALWLPGNNESMRVEALTHVAVHISPDNPHYGINGDYKNCGTTAPRDKNEVEKCLSANEVWYVLWGGVAPNGQASAMASFNPDFSQLAAEINRFLDDITPN